MINKVPCTCPMNWTKVIEHYLTSSMTKFLGFSFKQHSLLTLSGDLVLKKNNIKSTEKITMKSPKNVQLLCGNLKALKFVNLNFR